MVVGPWGAWGVRWGFTLSPTLRLQAQKARSEGSRGKVRKGEWPPPERRPPWLADSSAIVLLTTAEALAKVAVPAPAHQKGGTRRWLAWDADRPPSEKPSERVARARSPRRQEGDKDSHERTRSSRIRPPNWVNAPPLCQRLHKDRRSLARHSTKCDGGLLSSRGGSLQQPQYLHNCFTPVKPARRSAAAPSQTCRKIGISLRCQNALGNLKPCMETAYLMSSILIG